MIDTARYFLHRVAEKIPDNPFATAFYNRLKNAGDTVGLDALTLLDIPLKEGDSLEDVDYARTERRQDYRFLHLYLKAFRKFPPLSDSEYYGVSFVEEDGGHDRPLSTLIQGGNGSGKTSVFGAMEYLFTGKMSSAKKQGYLDKGGLEKYLPYAGARFEAIDINVVTRSLRISLDANGYPKKEVLALCLSPFFCSEYDVDRLVEDKLNVFVYEQMGYTSVNRIIQKMGSEIDKAMSQHDTLNYTLENVESRVAELDKTIGTCERLKPSFLFLVFNRITNIVQGDLLDRMKEQLSEAYVLEADPDDDKQGVRPLNGRVWEDEMNNVLNALGEKAKSQYFVQLYMKMNQFLQIGRDGSDSLLTQNDRSEEVSRTLEELNQARHLFRQIVSVVFDKTASAEPGSDFVSYTNRYEEYIKGLRQELQLEENKKKTIGEDQRFMANKGIYEEFLKTLRSEVYGTVRSVTEGARAMLNEIMELFIMEDERMLFDFDEKEGKFKMNITLEKPGGIGSTKFPPEQYFNTFRYKLYCMTLKIAIAFAVKKFYKINFPIVLDDLFYSSDFTHRGMVREFFRILFRKHREIFSNDDLQVIFLSHDEVVIEAAYRGISDIVTCSNVNRQVLFDYREADDPKAMTLPVTTETGETMIVNMRNLTCS